MSGSADNENNLNTLVVALEQFIDYGYSLEKLGRVLMIASEKTIVSYTDVQELCGEEAEDILLLCWKWKLLIPLRTLGSGEWDDRIFLAEPGESYQIPNISKFLIDCAQETGNWDSHLAIGILFQIMNEPSWEKIPELVLAIMAKATDNKVNAMKIREACSEVGMESRVDAMIAILKGSGIISPNLGPMAQVIKIGLPVYEINPCVFIEMR